jgi:hypothetical protein
MKSTLRSILPEVSALQIGYISSNHKRRKSKYTRFSDLTCVRRVYTIDQDSATDTLEITDSDACIDRLPLKSKEQIGTKEEQSAISPFDEEVSDTIVATKQTEGPSQATLATQKLFKVVKQTKKISRHQVLEIMRSLDMPSLTSTLSSRNRDIVPCDQSDKADNQEEGPRSSPADDLTQQVISHLRSLASRIDINGKASLLPCATTLDRRYLPIIRFLLSCFTTGALDLVRD